MRCLSALAVTVSLIYHLPTTHAEVNNVLFTNTKANKEKKNAEVLVRGATSMQLRIRMAQEDMKKARKRYQDTGRLGIKEALCIVGKAVQRSGNTVPSLRIAVRGLSGGVHTQRLARFFK